MVNKKLQGQERVNKLTLGLGLLFVFLEFSYIGIKVGVNLSNMSLAVIPAILVMAITKWFASPEMVNNRALLLAFLNGALIAFSLATILSLVVVSLVPLPGYIIAGTTEELVKGFVIAYLLKFWDVRYKPTQVLILGLSLGAGFAFTENMLYFTSARTAEKLGLMFIGRGLVTPFAHPLFTAVIAYAVGLWLADKTRNGTKFLITGYLGATFIHSLYDWSTTFLSVLALSISVIALIFIELFLERNRRAENKIINSEVVSYIEFLPTVDRELLVNLKERTKAQHLVGKNSRASFKIWISLWRELILSESFNPEFDVRHAYILLTHLKREWFPGYHSNRAILLEKIDLDFYKEFLMKNYDVIASHMDIETELAVIENIKFQKAHPVENKEALIDFNYKDQTDTTKDDPFGLDGGDK